MTDIVLGIRLTADGKGLVGEVKLSREEIEKLTKATKESNAAAGSGADDNRRYGESLQNIGRFGAIAGAAVVALAGALALKVKNTVEAAAALGRMSEQTGRSVESLQRMKYAEDQLGIANGALIQSYQQLPKTIVEAMGPNSEAARALKALGIDPKQVRDTDQGMALIADRVKQVHDPMVQAALATMIFKQRGEELLPYLKLGSEGIRELGERGSQYADITKEGARQAEELRRQWVDLQQSGGALARMIQSDLLPWLVQTVQKMQDASRISGGMFKGVGLMVSASGDYRGDLKDMPERIAGLDKDIARFQSFGSDPSSLLMARTEAQDRLDYAQSRQRQAALLGGIDDSRELRRVGGGAGGPGINATLANLGRDIKGPRADTTGDTLVRGLQDQLASLSGEGSEADKVIRRLTDGTHQFTLAQQAAAIALAGEIDDLKAYQTEVKRAAEYVEAITKLDAERAAVLSGIQVTFSQHLQQYEDETRLLGMSEPERRREVELLKIKRMELEAIAKLDPELLGAEAYGGAVGDVYSRGGQLRNAAMNREAAREISEQAKKNTEEFNALWSTVERTGKDVFVQLTSHGTKAFDAIGKSIKASIIDMLYQLTVRRWIIQIGTTVAGSMGIAGAAGAAGGGGGGGGGVSDMFGMASNASNLFGGGAGIFGSTAAYSVATGAGASQAAMLAAQTGVFGAEGLAATAGMSAAGAGAASMAAAAIPYIGLAIMAYQMLKTKKTSAVGLGYQFDGAYSNAGGLGLGMTGLTNVGPHPMNFEGSGYKGPMEQQLALVVSDLRRLSQVMGIDASRLGASPISVSYQTGLGTSAEADAQIVATGVAAISDQLALQLLPNLKSLAQQGESLTQTFVRIGIAARQSSLGDISNRMGVALGLQDATSDLWLSDLSPLTAAQRLAQARGRYDETLGLARGGDARAMGDLGGISRTYLQESRGFYASSPDYSAIFNEVQASVTDLVTDTLTEQSIRFAEMGLTLKDISSNTKDLDTRIATALQSAIDAWQAAQLAVQEAAADQITAAITALPAAVAAVATSANSAAFIDSDYGGFSSKEEFDAYHRE